ncbi:MAG: competence protein ComEA [Gordonia sp. (in: high G+C Gram-positive bacteria)]|nr:MAG: competence protein ComEA [Gordonia sp. (in: high G+C Gram-positive bacteria)]
MRSNLDRLTASPTVTDTPEPSVPVAEPMAPAWLGSAQWMHDNPDSPGGGDDAPPAGAAGGARGHWTDDPDDVDAGPLRRRWRSTPAAAIGLVAVGVVATLIALYTAFAGPDAGSEVPVNFPESAGVPAPMDTAPTPSSAAPPAELVVSVVGLVHRPGLVRLPPQARVADAIDKAGGAKQNADLLTLNLAQPLRDGDQVLVGFTDPAGGFQMRSAVVAVDGAGSPPAAAGTAPPGPAPAGTADGAGKVNLNTATEAELDTLPGVGPVTAAAIIAWRQAHGSFTSVDQLAEVDGIGPARLEKLKDKVTV